MKLPPPGERLQEITCGSCIGACCLKNTVLALSQKEAARLLGAGTEMHKEADEAWKGKVPRPGFRREYYRFDSDCGNLNPETNECQDYPNRPLICQQFAEGGYGCVGMRLKNGVDNLGPTLIQLTVKPGQLITDGS